MFYTRALTKVVEDASATYPVVVLTGPRQTGKTTLLSSLAEKEGRGRKNVSLDWPAERELATRDPYLFLQRWAPPVLIDEIQYAPQLLPFIKIYADTHKTNGDFWITGSQTFHLMNNVTESLAGRAAVLRLSGLSTCELAGVPNRAFALNPALPDADFADRAPMSLSEVYARILRGSMPRLYENPGQDSARYYSSYVETYISRDIKALTQVADEMTFLRFMAIAAARTGLQTSYAALAQETGVSAPTAKKWLSVLASSGIVFFIAPWSGNMLTRVIKSPRMYFSDTGLAAHLAGWTNADALERGAGAGQFFETWVVSEIYKSYLNAGATPPLFWLRTASKQEIDLLVYANNTLTPIEIKKTSHPGANAAKNFGALSGVKGAVMGTGAIVCMAPSPAPLDRRTRIIPAWAI